MCSMLVVNTMTAPMPPTLIAGIDIRLAVYCQPVFFLLSVRRGGQAV